MSKTIEAWGADLVVPDPPPRPIGALTFLKHARRNELSIFDKDAFVKEVSETNLFFRRIVLVNNPDFIKQVLVTKHENYVKGRLARQMLGPLLGNGLFLSEGAFWRRQRRITAPAFHHNRLAALGNIMTERAQALVDRWKGPADRGEALDVFSEMQELTMDIVMRCLFSADITKAAAELGESISTALSRLGKPNILNLLDLPSWLPRRRDTLAEEAIARIEHTIYDIIARRRAGPMRRDDLLSMLMDARDEETGEGMTDRQLRDEIMTLFGAGHETTAIALTWTWYLLSQHPEVERRLHDEIDNALAARRPTFADLESLPYTRMVIEESLRLFPPAFAISRIALQDDQLGDHKVRRGSLVLVSPYVTHRNPKLWPDPSRFDPGRFTLAQANAPQRYAYLPFGAGPRICIGNNFAMMEARLILASIAQKYRLGLVSGHLVEAFGRVTMRPRYGLRIEPKLRAPQRLDRSASIV